MNGSAEHFTVKPERISGMLPMRKMVHPVDGFFLKETNLIFSLYYRFQAIIVIPSPINESDPSQILISRTSWMHASLFMLSMWALNMVATVKFRVKALIGVIHGTIQVG